VNKKKINLQERLSLCDYKSRKMFQDLEPIMRNSELYGWLEESVEGLSKRLVISRQMVYQCISNLKRNGILRHGKNGLYCPFIVAEFVLRTKR